MNIIVIRRKNCIFATVNSSHASLIGYWSRYREETLHFEMRR